MFLKARRQLRQRREPHVDHHCRALVRTRRNLLQRVIAAHPAVPLRGTLGAELGQVAIIKEGLWRTKIACKVLGSALKSLGFF